MTSKEAAYPRQRVETAELTHAIPPTTATGGEVGARPDLAQIALHPCGKPEATGYLFLPSRLRRAKFLKWLRRTHAWLGLWGAALALLFGSTGILLNHRAIMKIPDAKIEQTVIQLPLPEPRPADAEALARWLQVALKVGKPPALIKAEPAQTVIWNGEAVRQPQLWRIFFASPQRVFNVEYWDGNAFVTIKRQDPNLFALLTQLHKGTGANAAWVLLVDTLAGGLIVLTLTGILLWSRLHGPRLLALGLLGCSLGGLAFFAWLST